jgi:hypothetical protein
MKTFYTERDIADMHATGVTEIEIDDDVIMTDLAREKAIALGLKMKLVAQRSGQPAGLPRLAVAPQMQLPPAVNGPTSPPPLASTAPAPAVSEIDVTSQIKSAVIARLGTNAHNDLLDQIIPQVLARLTQRS